MEGEIKGGFLEAVTESSRMRRIWEAKSGKRSAFQLEGACVEYKKGDSLERGKRQAGPCSGTSVQGARSGRRGRLRFRKTPRSWQEAEGFC